MINGSTKKYGLFGYPITHTLSPAMHNAAFNKLKLNAVYLPLEVSPENIKQAVQSIKALTLSGVNVTIPHKETCMKYLDKITPEAEAIGAVNTVVIKNNELIGYNTDGVGFVKSIQQSLKIKPSGKCFFIIGAGGGAKAVAVQLAKEGAKEIRVTDMVKEKSLKIRGAVNKISKKCKVFIVKPLKKVNKLQLEGIDLLVNATPIGMKKTDPLIVDFSGIKKICVYDLIYNPSETKLLKAAKKKSFKTANGLGMLLNQGAAAFELWTGKKPPVEVMKKALLQK